MHAHEVEALPVTEFLEWIAHFQLAAERREKKHKPQNQIPKKEREAAAGDVSTG